MFDFLLGRSPDRFARRVMRRLRARGWPHALAYDRETFTIDTGSGSGALHLGNLFRDWPTYPRRERAAQLDRAISMVFESVADETFEQAADNLIPVVRNLTHLQATALESPSDPSPEIWQPYQVLAGPLGVVLAIDRPSSMALVQTSKLEGWGLTFEAALERAMDNLIARSPVRFTRMEAGFHVSAYGDFFDSSRLLMPELFTALQVKGDPVAVAISRSCVVVAGSEEAEALNAMAAFVAETVKEETRPTSFLPLVLRGGAWIAADPYASTPDSIRELAIEQHAWDHGVQTQVLEAYLARQGEDVFVAPLEAGRFKGDAHTWTSWTEGVRATLPRSEALGLTSTGGRRLFRFWRDVEAVCGPFVADATLHPPRFTPPAWPSAEAWRRLEAEFRPPEWSPLD